VGGKACWLTGVWKVSGCRQTMGKQICPLSLGEDDVKRVLLVCGSGFRRGANEIWVLLGPYAA
jgi:hypothetical protein